MIIRQKKSEHLVKEISESAFSIKPFKLIGQKKFKIKLKCILDCSPAPPQNYRTFIKLKKRKLQNCLNLNEQNFPKLNPRRDSGHAKSLQISNLKK